MDARTIIRLLTRGSWEAPAAETGIKAWHGSPFKFNAFDMDRTRSGFGARLTGPGHSFTDDPNVAEFYKNLQPYNSWFPRLRPGSMYEVDINSKRSQLLNLDNPLARQSAYVKKAVEYIREDLMPGVSLKAKNPNNQPAVFLDSLNKTLGSESKAVDAMKEAKLYGARTYRRGTEGYGGSDEAPKMNEYSIWNPDIINILKRYGIAAPGAGVAAGAALDQPNEQ